MKELESSKQVSKGTPKRIILYFKRPTLPVKVPAVKELPQKATPSKAIQAQEREQQWLVRKKDRSTSFEFKAKRDLIYAPEPPEMILGFPLPNIKLPGPFSLKHFFDDWQNFIIGTPFEITAWQSALLRAQKKVDAGAVALSPQQWDNGFRPVLARVDDDAFSKQMTEGSAMTESKNKIASSGATLPKFLTASAVLAMPSSEPQDQVPTGVPKIFKQSFQVSPLIGSGNAVGGFSKGGNSGQSRGFTESEALPDATVEHAQSDTVKPYSEERTTAAKYLQPANNPSVAVTPILSQSDAATTSAFKDTFVMNLAKESVLQSRLSNEPHTHLFLPNPPSSHTSSQGHQHLDSLQCFQHQNNQTNPDTATPAKDNTTLDTAR